MMEIAICPNCGVKLEQDEVYTTDLMGSYIDNCIVGHCPTCGKKFQWIEIYDYIGTDEIKEVT